MEFDVKFWIKRNIALANISFWYRKLGHLDRKREEKRREREEEGGRKEEENKKRSSRNHVWKL